MCRPAWVSHNATVHELEAEEYGSVVLREQEER
jgi:hypothetical protein